MTVCEAPSPYCVYVVVVVCPLQSARPRTKHKMCAVGLEANCSWFWIPSPPMPSLPQLHGILSPWKQAALRPGGSPHAQLHARCQALSIFQLESHPESGFSPFQLLCNEGQEHPFHLSSHVPGSVSHSQLLHSFIHRGRGLELHRPVLSLRPWAPLAVGEPLASIPLVWYGNPCLARSPALGLQVWPLLFRVPRCFSATY